MTSHGHRSSPEVAHETARIEEFLRRFFGAGNDAARYPEIVEPFIRSLRGGDDAPAVLPRFVNRLRPGRDQADCGPDRGIRGTHILHERRYRSRAT
jgi:hypothetical protein